VCFGALALVAPEAGEVGGGANLPEFRALPMRDGDRPLEAFLSGYYAASNNQKLTSRISLPRNGSRVDLHVVLFEACSAFTRVAACTLALSPIRDSLIEGFSHFVASMTAPIASEAVAGWGLHPLESAAFSRRTSLADIFNDYPR
jgi:hypothetical protein